MAWEGKEVESKPDYCIDKSLGCDEVVKKVRKLVVLLGPSSVKESWSLSSCHIHYHEPPRERTCR